jgi:hypothetical protein
MTGISLHMQWPLTSQLHGSFSLKKTICFSLRIKLHAIRKALHKIVSRVWWSSRPSASLLASTDGWFQGIQVKKWFLWLKICTEIKIKQRPFVFDKAFH